MERKAHEFAVTWDEIKEYFDNEEDYEYTKFGEMFAQNTGPDENFLNILTKFFNSRNNEITPQRGDILYLSFVDYRQYGRFFYDGEKIIRPGNECGSDYYNIPLQFKFPSEFSPDHWNKTGFLGYCTNCLPFDVDKNTNFTFIKNIDSEDTIVKIYQESKHNYYIIFSINKEFSSFEDCFQEFKENGLCFYIQTRVIEDYDLSDYLNDEICDEFEKYVDIEKTIFVLS